MYCFDDKGFPKAALRNSIGNLVEDQRNFQPYTPLGVHTPNFICSSRLSPTRDEIRLPWKAWNPKVIKRSAKGNIYKMDTDEGKAILKEGYRGTLIIHGKDSSADRILNEVSIMQHLDKHIHAPRILGISSSEHSIFLLEEYIDGVSLEKVFEDTRVECGDPVFLHKIICNLYREINKVHKSGIIIRDLSPNNIIVDVNGQISLVDFELASFSSNQRTLPGATPGFFPAFLALSAQRNAVQYDWYAYGAILFYLATSIKPILVDTELADKREAFFKKIELIAQNMDLNDVASHTASLGIYLMKNFTTLHDDFVGDCIKHLSKFEFTQPLVKSENLNAQVVALVHCFLNTRDWDRTGVGLKKSNHREQLLCLSLDRGSIGLLILEGTYLLRYRDEILLRRFKRQAKSIDKVYHQRKSYFSNVTNGTSSLILLLSIAKILDESSYDKYTHLQLEILEKISNNLTKISYNGVLYGLAGIGLILYVSSCVEQVSPRGLARNKILYVMDEIANLLISRIKVHSQRYVIALKECENDKKVYSTLDFGFGLSGVGTFLALSASRKNITKVREIVNNIYSDILTDGLVKRNGKIIFLQSRGGKKAFPFLFSGLAGFLVFLKASQKIVVDSAYESRLNEVRELLLQNNFHHASNISNGDAGVLLALNYVEGFQSHDQEMLVKIIISESTKKDDGSVGWSVPGSFKRVGDYFWEGNTGIFYALIMYCVSEKKGEV